MRDIMTAEQYLDRALDCEREAAKALRANDLVYFKFFGDAMRQHLDSAARMEKAK